MTKYPFSEASMSKLGTCRGDLIDLFIKVSDVIDCTVICGSRSKEAQDEAVRTGASKTPWPNSKHNVDGADRVRSRAVDVAPYPIDWDDRERFVYFAGIVKGVAGVMGIGVRWGGDWDSDNDLRDQTFMDLVHFEAIK